MQKLPATRRRLGVGVTDLASQVESALHARQAKRRGDEIDFLCVAHDNTNTGPASWNRKKDSWHCMSCGAGGSTRDLAERLGIQAEAKKPSREECAYDYRDADGKLVYQVVRMIPKDFRQRRPDGGGGWIWNLQGVTRVLYRLPELLASSGRVFIVEGEKDTDSLRALGLVATTSVGGAGKWRDQYNAAFQGREVVVLPDNDADGEKHGAFVAQALTGTASSVRILRLTGLDKKGDVSDWLRDGGTVEELTALADAAPEWAAKSATPAGAADYPETDSGNAELFAHLYGDHVRFDWKRDRWLVWDRHRWVPDATGELIRLGIETARVRMRAAAELYGEQRDAAFRWSKASESAGKIEAMLKLGRAIHPIADSGEGWDANPMLIGCENGVVNLATGELRAGKREDRITRSTGIEYRALWAAPRWLRFLEEVFPDAAVRAYVSRAIGYSLTGSTREQVWFLCHGIGANGKGTLMDAIRWAIGDYGHVMAFSTIEKNKEQSIPLDMAALTGRRFVTVSEAGEYARVNEERVKGLTGEDPVTARELYKPQFTFQPELKLWLAVNHLPAVQDDSEGYWRRVRALPFLETFPVERRDLNLRAKLKEELPGILAWAVAEAVEWHKHGLGQVPAAVAVATVEYREESDPLAGFIRDRCVVTANAKVGGADFYKAYRAWTTEQGWAGGEVMTGTMFGKKVSERFRKVKNGTGRMQYGGIGILADGWNGPQLSVNTEGRESKEGWSPETNLAPPASMRKLPENHQNPPYHPYPETCLCEACPLPADAALDCSGAPFFPEAEGLHCRTHHSGSAISNT